MGGLRLLCGFGRLGWDAGISGCLPPLAVPGNRSFPPRTNAASISRARVGRYAGRLLCLVSIDGLRHGVPNCVLGSAGLRLWLMRIYAAARASLSKSCYQIVSG